MLLVAMIVSISACTSNQPAADNTPKVVAEVNTTPPPPPPPNVTQVQPPPVKTPPPVQTNDNIKYKTFYINASQANKYTPNKINVNQYDMVRIYITAVDATEGFAIYDSVYSFNEVIPQGETDKIEFNATKAGIFTFKCSAACTPVMYDGTLTVSGQNSGPNIQR